jgi:peptide/nickel transport system ATP-binding protein
MTVDDLRVDVPAAGVDIVAEVSFALRAGTALGIVGESGSGKTTVAMALLGFARDGTEIVKGRVDVDGQDILALSPEDLRAARGRIVSYVPQNPARSLSPAMPVGSQLTEMLRAHVPDSSRHARLFDEAWAAAQLPPDRAMMRSYPHQLSGGQQQRVAIAMALVCEPKVVVMDEPTTGLDVLTQERLLEVVGGLRQARDVSLVYVSHDLGVVRNLVDHVAVMYAGRIVEYAPVDELFREPRHPYTRRLLEAIPRVHRPTRAVRGIPGHAVEPWNRPIGCPFAPRCDYRSLQCEREMPPVTAESSRLTRCWRVEELVQRPPAPVVAATRLEVEEDRGAERALLKVSGLVATYPGRRGSGGRSARQPVAAVNGVSFEAVRAQCLAVVGESGSGKSTLARCLVGLHAPSAGEILFDGNPLAALARRRDAATRRRIQIVFQDPDSSLNPTMTVGDAIRRPLVQFFDLSSRARAVRVGELLERVRLPSSMARRLPRDLSGGEKQRVAIARALAASPDLLVCDEVTSALDVAVQASILELLSELRFSQGMTLVFITHDLAVVRTMADVVVVMSQGQVRELEPTPFLFASPRDDYTRRLLAATPDLHDGDYPDPVFPAPDLERTAP